MRRMRRSAVLYLVLVVAVIFCTLAVGTACAGPLPGAIFTTLSDGSAVNHNIYSAKTDVYLDGGPGPNAPSTAAGLPEGDYYFQVTDPSGKVLLSTDPVGARKFHINEFGVIDFVYPYLVWKKITGVWQWVNIAHLTGIDIDHSELGAIAVQLMPYSNTPNNGGVYKVWITPCDKFVGDPTKVDNLQYVHGFIPAWSKTDNYKVKGRIVPPIITVRKFDDSNANGVWDVGENEIFGWPIDVIDPLTVENTFYTKAEIIASPSGAWTITEDDPINWIQTCVYVGGVLQSLSNTAVVNVAGTSGEIHEVIYGNIQLGSLKGWKWYDLIPNGVWDEGEPPIAGWKMVYNGTDLTGASVYAEAITNSEGCADFGMFLPGTGTVTEIFPIETCWQETTQTLVAVTITEGGSNEVFFGNVCIGTADFNTKGYWHNKNGLQETVQADFDYLNSLASYSSPSSYFGAGDEPFDGFFANGDPVEAAWEDGVLLWAGGTAWAEQSQFLVDSNAGGDPREQLAQQLDAFIMNCRHRLGGGGSIWLNGGWVSTSDLIAEAVSIWQSGSASEQNNMAGILDGLNNSDAVPFVKNDPCPIDY